MDDTQYDAAGRVTKRVLGEDGVQTQYSYYTWNTAIHGGLLQQITAGIPSDTDRFLNLQYTNYDQAGNVREIKDWVNGSPQTQSFAYDNPTVYTFCKARSSKSSTLSSFAQRRK